MNTLIKSFLLLIAINLLLVIKPEKAHAQDANVSFQVFYDNLSPYGHWVQHPRFGYIWTPNVDGDFVPYSTAGHWVWTDDYGWTWASDYDWGWAPFHYGRWGRDDDYGWFWIPDEVWGPAWVCWRHAPGYYGWAPLGPGITIDMAEGGRWHPRDDRWVFMKEGYMGEANIHDYYAPRGEISRYVRSSSFVNNAHRDDEHGRTYVMGPRREEVEKIKGRPLNRVEFHESDKPEHSVKENRLNTYRPAIQHGSSNMGPHPAPAKIEKIETVGRPIQNHDQPRMEQPRQQPQRIEQPRQQQQPRMEQPRQQSQPRQSAPQQPRGGGGGRR